MLPKVLGLFAFPRYFFPSYATGIGEMTRSKSIRLLGTSGGGGVAARYRVLSKLNHPDLGGSPYLSSKINEAKAFLEAHAMPL